ncbi:CPBP family intramembrane metalloprotease [Candidatus Uhrbacteria bacterium]|nr:CPBP family intramembrane metalloprotease [Candidatus Uhrbacteria bacterium]
MPFDIPLQILTLIALPTTLLYLGVIPLAWRGWVLIAVTLAVVGIMIRERWSPKDLGLRGDTLRSGWSRYGIVTLLGIAAIVGIAFVTGRRVLPAWWMAPHFLGGFLIVSIAQELVFRGFLIPKLHQLLRSPAFTILANALLFTAVHAIFPSPAIVLPLTFVGGLLLALLYVRYPNLVLVTLAHIALNVTATLYCFASTQTSCVA